MTVKSLGGIECEGVRECCSRRIWPDSQPLNADETVSAAAALMWRSRRPPPLFVCLAAGCCLYVSLFPFHFTAIGLGEGKVPFLSLSCAFVTSRPLAQAGWRFISFSEDPKKMFLPACLCECSHSVWNDERCWSLASECTVCFIFFEYCTEVCFVCSL